MADESMYDAWIAHRRDAEPSGDLTDRVMVAVHEREVQPICCVRFADRMNESRLARWAACLASVLVGSLPFLLVAYVAQLLVF